MEPCAAHNDAMINRSSRVERAGGGGNRRPSGLVHRRTMHKRSGARGKPVVRAYFRVGHGGLQAFALSIRSVSDR